MNNSTRTPGASVRKRVAEIQRDHDKRKGVMTYHNRAMSYREAEIYAREEILLALITPYMDVADADDDLIEILTNAPVIYDSELRPLEKIRKEKRARLAAVEKELQG